jgi:hypothetical protein
MRKTNICQNNYFLYTNKNTNKHSFRLLFIIHFNRLIIIDELFLYLYHINDIHKYRFEDFLRIKKKYMKSIKRGMNTYDIRDHISLSDKMYMARNNQDMLNDYNHIDLFDQKQEDLICHIMVCLN